jgi:hypothetical protein
MDEVITRIVEIEKQCSANVEQAELEYGKRIEAHKRILEEKKTRERALIISAENTRLTKAVEEAKILTEGTSAALRRDSESLFQDPLLNEAIIEDIISILLER